MKKRVLNVLNVKCDVADNDNKCDVTNESDQDDKWRKKRKCDVKNESVDHDVTNVEVDTERDEENNKGDITNESEQDDKRRKKRKCYVTDNDNKGDVTNESEQDDKWRKKRKRDVKNESVVNVDQEEDEVIILKRNKTTLVSLWRSGWVQQKKNEMKGHLKKLQDQRTKNLAGQFVFSKSSVTDRPPEGYYGKFSVTEHNVKGGSKSVHDEDNDIQEVDLSSSTDKVVIKKPKKGFIDNELFPDDTLDVSYDTLKSNINKSISRLEADDIDLDHIMNDDGVVRYWLWCNSWV